MHFAMPSNGLQRVTLSSVLLGMLALLILGMPLAFQTDISDSSKVIAFCQQWGVGLVVVGPETPLVAGLANDLAMAGIPTFGPSVEAAALKGSKDFMKKLCDKYQIPTAKYQTFTQPEEAKHYIQEQGVPIVIKANGLAAGKGVVVALTLDEVYKAVDSMLVEGVFGAAGCKIIIEEYLEGEEEASFFALVDGENALPLEPAQDHKLVGMEILGQIQVVWVLILRHLCLPKSCRRRS